MYKNIFYCSFSDDVRIYLMKMVRKYGGRILSLKLKNRMQEAAGINVFGKPMEVDEERMIIGANNAMSRIRREGYSGVPYIRWKQEGLIILFDICSSLKLEGMYDFETNDAAYKFADRN